MRFFLIAYNRRLGEVEDPREFASQVDALTERFRLEVIRTDPDLEIVVLGAESIDDLKRTHSRYFKTVAELARG